MERWDIFTRYDATGASSRLRYYFYERFLTDAGLEPHIHPFFDSDYLKKLYSGRGKSRFAALKSTLRRWNELRTAGKNLLIEYELFPQLPAALELAFLKNRRYILNFDDLVWKKYENLPFLSGKYDRLIERSAGVIVANDLLLEKVSPLQPNTIKIPTAIDLDSYPATRKKFDRFTVAWIGTPVTYTYLEHFSALLREISRTVDFELLTIARSDLPPLPGVRQRHVDWSAATEAELLSRCHAGIMPLTDDDFSRGKSAYKLIQYMAAGIPAIASPVGENLKVLQEGVTGFFARTPEEWRQALLRLSSDKELSARMGAEAKKRAYDYSLQKYAPVMIDFLRRASI